MHEIGDGGEFHSFLDTISTSPGMANTTPPDVFSHTNIGTPDSVNTWTPSPAPYGSQGPAWVGLLVLGIMLIISGMMSIAFFSAPDTSGGYYDPFAQQDADFNRTTDTMGGIMIFGGLVMILVSFLVKSHESSLAERMAATRSEQAQSEPEKRVVEEVIKVRCRYCSTLNDVSAKHCISCGAVL